MNAEPTPSADAVSQGMLFQRLRWTIWRNARLQLFGHSRLRLFTMFLACLIVWGVVFVGAYGGFEIVAQSKLFFAGGIIGLVFDTMFFTLGGMLVFSTGLILYASLFTGSETRFLLTTPARADQIFAFKFQGALAFSSWGFLILGAPILIAYGIIFDVPWHFYALLPVYFLGYTLLPGTVGAVLCLLIVNYLPQRRKQAILCILAILLVVGGYWVYQTMAAATDAMRRSDSLQKLFDMFALAQNKLMPSRWMSQGLLASARGEFRASLFPLAMIWTNGLFFYVLGTWLAKKLYRRGYNRLSEGGSSRKQVRGVWLDRLMAFLVGYLPGRMRVLIIKDFRTFRREPAQVWQLAIFAGLMLLGVMNVRQFLGADIPLVNQTAISVLNLEATGLLMCAYLARFIYPLISLEGRKFWILGLLPLNRADLLWGKFAFAVTMTGFLAGSLVLLSDLVLGVSFSALAFHLLTVLLLAIGLSGLSVGMSAAIPNFRETDPSKIVVGFGGTMFTLVSLLYLGLISIVMVLPYHLMAMTNRLTQEGGLPWWVYLGIPIGVFIATIAVVIPMRIGRRTLDRMEF